MPPRKQNDEGKGGGEVVSSSTNDDLLADLTALQREVDALRGVYDTSGQDQGQGQGKAGAEAIGKP